jgi:hypothetical protein
LLIHPLANQETHMLTRWMIRIAFFTGMIGATAIAGAQENKAGAPAAPAPSGGAAAPAPPSRGSADRPPGGNGSRNAPKPAPQPAPPPPPAPVRPAAPVNPPTNVTRDATPRDRVAPDPNRPRTAEEAQREAQRERQLHPNPRTIIVAPGLSTWGPYTWWYSGSSYWWPPLDGTYDRRDDEYSREGTATSNYPPANLPAPSQVQAQSVNQLEGMPEYRQLVAELKKAQNEYETASRRAIEKVKSNPEYQALVKERDKAQSQVEAVQASAKIPPPAERVTPAAEKKLDVSTRITRMEQDAIAADPQASAAKARMVDLNERLTAMRKQAEGAQIQGAQLR